MFHTESSDDLVIKHWPGLDFNETYTNEDDIISGDDIFPSNGYNVSTDNIFNPESSKWIDNWHEKTRDSSNDLWGE